MTEPNTVSMPGRSRFTLAALILGALPMVPAFGQDGGWQGWPDFSAPNQPTTSQSPAPPDTPEPDKTPVAIEFEALLIADGQRIEQGLTWRIYAASDAPGGKERLVETEKAATPSVELAPGSYIVNAAFGRAHMTRRITVKAGEPAREQFVLNAGGLRMKATVNGAPPSASPVTIEIFADERDQFNNRTLVMSGAKTDLIHRLNAGLYQIVSKFGDANVSVIADVTVEAGKLTEVTLAHTCSPTTFRLVAKPGGEALPETRWVIQTRAGEIVKQTAGALPTHVLAAGPYTVIATSDGREFRRDFDVAGGGPQQVEVVMR